ncbi:exodeoxyribonuclease VII large subunit [Sulfurimonas sp.]|uniref:exodeoxyribonuclease VII large subunit n=1 Tax=Sulfurimonas sp. TaxID=2022749 RepID=UPI002606F0D6|nr:exodeoxyribonuclease VII large subunit [Sulfurimonas sp.]
MLMTLTVSALNEQIKSLLEESFSRVLVEGELSRITFHNSGHIYFTLKDSSSSLSAVMFRGNASKLKFRLEEGMKVVIDGAITLYKPRGAYQINCFSIEPSGQGALAVAYEQLKLKLSNQGYFDTQRKKSLPQFPSKITLITSETGAALQDMLRVANRRYRALEIDIYDVLVQGESAASSIANAIKIADAKEYDIIVIGRGGGSLEDLWAFNKEIVADAIFYAKTPIVSAVGHEIDWMISDFVADLRAPTPSAAMEMILPDTNELYLSLDGLTTQFTERLSNKIATRKQAVLYLKNLYAQHSVEKLLEQKKEEITKLKNDFTHTIAFKLQGYEKDMLSLKQRFPQAIDTTLNIAQHQLLSLKKMLESNNPKYKNKKGFAQIVKESKVVALSSLEVDDIFEAQSDMFVVRAKVLQKEKIK